MLGRPPFYARLASNIPKLALNSPIQLRFLFYTHARIKMPIRAFASSLFKSRGQQSPQARVSPIPESLPLDVAVDEEKLPGYRSDDYYAARLGDVLDGRYELKAKVGWGSTSTVWLAQDIRSRLFRQSKFVVLKICNSDASEEDARHELDMNMYLSSIKSTHQGHDIIGTALEGFSFESARASTHLVLVLEPMREPLWLFRRRLGGQNQVTRPFLPLIKIYLQALLEGLDFLHSECHVIHTDLKLDNIMVTFEHDSIVEDFIQGQTIQPMGRKTVGERTVYRCHNDFGALKDNIDAVKHMYPKITDFGLAQRGDRPGPLIHPIQPNDYHAPEVLLGTGWSYGADIWNFGTMVWDLLAGQSLFQQETAQSSYSAAQHLAEMMALLGPVPSAMLQRERDMRCWRWSPEALNPVGILSSNAAEFFGGPFFGDDGAFLHEDLIPSSRDWMTKLPECIPDEEADRFISFMKSMLCWSPDARATAGELKNHPLV